MDVAEERKRGLRSIPWRRLGKPVVITVILAAALWAGAKVLPGQWARWFPGERKEVFIPTAQARRGELVVSVRQLGSVEAERSVLVSSEIEGKIIYLVPEGRSVSPGERLVQLDDAPLREAVRTATLEYNNARAQVEKAKLEFEIQKESNRTEVEQQEAQLNFDRAELERAQAQLEKKKRLAADRLIPQSEVEVAEIDVRSKQFNVTKQEKALALKRKEVESRESQKQAEVRNVEFSAEMAAIRLKEAQGRLRKSRILAPKGGLVVIQKVWTPDGRRKFKEGDSVFPQQQILQLPDLSSMLVKAQVEEADIARVKVGQSVRLTLDALPGKTYSGAVQEISSLATEASPWETSGTPGRKNFEVTIKINTSGVSPIRPGMTANVEIISDRVKDTVYVPIEAVFEKEGKRLVYVKRGASFVPREVETGKRNETFVAIRRGLRKGEVVALKDPSRQESPAGRQEKPAALPLPAPARSKS